jgi:hypothetical protein
MNKAMDESPLAMHIHIHRILIVSVPMLRAALECRLLSHCWSLLSQQHHRRSQVRAMHSSTPRLALAIFHSSFHPDDARSIFQCTITELN